MSWLKNREIQLTQQETALFINAAQSYLYRTKELQKKTKKKTKTWLSTLRHCEVNLLRFQHLSCVLFCGVAAGPNCSMRGVLAMMMLDVPRGPVGMR